jgi:acyl-CoA thioester hydrolase
MKEFQIEVTLRWSDLDAMGHVNNVVYFRLMEEARVQWFEELGFPVQNGKNSPILAHASCNFVRAMSHPAVAVVKQTVTRLGRSSVEMDLAVERKDEPGLAYATGRTVMVWYDYATQQSSPWPQRIRDLIYPEQAAEQAAAAGSATQSAEQQGSLSV